MGHSKRAKIPPAPAPAPRPVAIDVEAIEKDRERRRQKLRQFGRAGTILTEGGLGELGSKKGTLLGGAA